MKLRRWGAAEFGRPGVRGAADDDGIAVAGVVAGVDVAAVVVAAAAVGVVDGGDGDGALNERPRLSPLPGADDSGGADDLDGADASGWR